MYSLHWMRFCFFVHSLEMDTCIYVTFSPLSIRWPCTKFRDLKCFKWLFEIIWYRQQNVKFLKFLLFFYPSFPSTPPFFVSTCVYFKEYFGCMTFSFYFNFYFPIISNGCALRQLTESRIWINWIVLYVGIPLSNTCNNLVMIICLVTIVTDKCLSTKHDWVFLFCDTKSNVRIAF